MRFNQPPCKPVTALIFLGACTSAVLAAGAQPSASLAQPAEAPSPLLSPSASTPAQSPSATPSPIATPTIMMLPPDAPPYILWYTLSSTSPHAGDVISGIVLTSSNVASVEVRVGGYSFNLPKTGVGRFEWTFQVPRLPFFVSHKMTMEIIARNTAGAATGTSFPFQIL